MATQTGPRLTIAGTCEGCAWLRPSTVGGARLGFVDCTHPARPVPFIGNVNTSITTPDGCPELPAARLALARSVVAEADRAQAEADRADIKRRMRMMPAEVMDDARAHGAGESEEQKR